MRKTGEISSGMRADASRKTIRGDSYRRPRRRCRRQKRVLVYSFDGQLKGTIAGHNPRVSASADLVTVHTESGELELYDLIQLTKRATYDFQSRVAFNGFSADGKRLLVLTSDQTVLILDTAAKPDSAVASR